MSDMEDKDIQTREDGTKWVPYTRFEKVVAARNDLQTKVQSYEQNQGQYQTQISEWQQKYERSQKEYQARFSMVKEGVDDPEIQDFVMSRYQVAGSDKAFDQWYGEYKASNPKILQPYLKSSSAVVTPPVTPAEPVSPPVQNPQQSAPPASAPAPQAPRPVDGSSNGIVPRQPPVSAFDPMQIANMDLATWKQMKGDVLKTLKG